MHLIGTPTPPATTLATSRIEFSVELRELDLRELVHDECAAEADERRADSGLGGGAR
jgi:hypothetical protein